LIITVIIIYEERTGRAYLGHTEAHSEHISGILRRIFKRMHIEDRVEEAGLFQVWDDVVGSRIARHTKPDRIIKGRLAVIAENSSYIQEYSFLRNEIKKKLNARLGKDIVKEVVFRTGEIKHEPRPRRPKTKRKKNK